MPSGLEIVSSALAEIQVIPDPGIAPQDRDATFSLARANRIVSLWTTQRYFLFTVGAARYTLSPSRFSYTIGRGTSPVADFIADRPLGEGPGNGIKNANIVLTASSPEVRVGLNILNDDQWAAISVQRIPTTIPTAIYNDGALPNSNLYLWGYPTAANDLELFTPQQLQQFPDLNTEVEFAPGYEEAFTLTLAEALSVPYGRDIPATLSQLAREARAAIQGLNSDSGYLTNDTAGLKAGPVKPTWNYLNGSI